MFETCTSQITSVLLSDYMTAPRQPGRPKTVSRNGTPRKVSLLFSPEQFRRLQARAKRQGLTVSELLRQAAA